MQMRSEPVALHSALFVVPLLFAERSGMGAADRGCSFTAKQLPLVKCWININWSPTIYLMKTATRDEHCLDNARSF